MKIKALEQGLIRKGLITETGALTTIGLELLVFLDTKNKTKLAKRKDISSDFDMWYDSFPGTDNFVHRGKSFKGSRTLRTDRAGCRIEFDKILLVGKYTAAQLIEALKFDVLQKKEESVKKNANQLTFIKSSFYYLKHGSYEAFIELIQQGVKIEEPIINKGTDI